MSESDFHNQPTLPYEKSDQEENLPLQIPENIGPYQIETLLEKGGMSILYLATHPETDVPTTIKALLPKFLSNKEVTERFLKEAEIISLADHPNIVRLFDQGEWEGGLYIAMEYIDGVSLRQYLLQTPLSLKRALEILLDISYAICHLHTHGVIHRDLKPENVLVTEDGEIKVIDFGIAQLLTEQETEKEPAKQKLIGTPVYMSPEQRKTPENVSFPSDIYSLGIIAYELITGKLSHGRIHLSILPQGIQKIIHKTLQPNPDDRYQDVVDFISDLTDFLYTPEVQQAKGVRDQLCTLTEDIREIQSDLCEKQAPNIEGLEIIYHTPKGASIASHKTLFYTLDGGRLAIITMESLAKGVEGLLQIAHTKGFLELLDPSSLSLTEKINEQLIKSSNGHSLLFSHTILSPNESKIYFQNCGLSPLFLYRNSGKDLHECLNENLALGISSTLDNKPIEIAWDSNDIAILPSFSLPLHQQLTTKMEWKKRMDKILKESYRNSLEKIAENLARKSQKSSIRPLQDRPLAFVAVKKQK